METISRVCTSNTQLCHEGLSYSVMEGTSVTVPIHALHMDPKYYPQPEEFRPERFSKEASKTRHPYVFLPFGAGPRECPGKFFIIIFYISGNVFKNWPSYTPRSQCFSSSVNNNLIEGGGRPRGTPVTVHIIYICIYYVILTFWITDTSLISHSKWMYVSSGTHSLLLNF